MANPIAEPFVEIPVAVVLSPLAHMAKARVTGEMREGGAWTEI